MLFTRNLILPLLFILFVLTSCQHDSSYKKTNILFIAVDDLRPELNTYGAAHIQSPNIDRLSSEGLTFTRAYCNVPVCGASRASLMTGIKPTKDRFVGFNTYAEKDAPGAIGLPKHFKDNGYYTISNGKVFHHRKDMIEGWSEEPWRPKSDNKQGRGYLTQKNMHVIDSTDDARAWPYEWADVHDEDYNDGKLQISLSKISNVLPPWSNLFSLLLDL
jgi:iduronate 2-sulfatase